MTLCYTERFKIKPVKFEHQGKFSFASLLFASLRVASRRVASRQK